MTLTRRIVRWSALALNFAATCYYGVILIRFWFGLDYSLAVKVGFIFSFKGIVFVSGFLAPALAVAALLLSNQLSQPSDQTVQVAKR